MVKKHHEGVWRASISSLRGRSSSDAPIVIRSSASIEDGSNPRTLSSRKFCCRFWPHLNYLNYGDFIFDRKGILSSVYLD
ncbi:hypothetical protein K1719_015943 [Acacia pycnantha]|nr:hypothetical protein K1719_015943 [Acacia pycnantha]